MERVKTKYFSKIIDEAEALFIFNYLKDNIHWEEGVRSRFGPTRKAKPIQLGINNILDHCVIKSLSKMGIKNPSVYGIYLNYYRDGNDWTPNHSHPGMKQVVISLGADRILTIAKNQHKMTNGDAIIFGSAIHGVPKDPQCLNGRISIALFLEK